MIWFSLMANGKGRDLLVLTGITLIAVLLSFVFRLSFLGSTGLFFGLPVLYLLFLEPRSFGKTLFAAVTFGIPFSFSLDFLAQANQAWVYGPTYFGRIGGLVEGDVIIWYFLMCWYMSLFYEHFVDRFHSKKRVTELGLGLLIIFVLAALVFAALYSINPALLLVPKAYLVICGLLYIPFLYILLQRPQLVWHALPVMFFFSFVFLAHEITALHLGQWIFNGDYLYLVPLFGVRFPIEELFFWIAFSGLVAGTYFEVFFDNKRNR